MKLFNRVTIIGLGLIGGSVGLALKKKGLAGEVVGVSRRSSTIRKALSLRVVDHATLDVKKGVKDSDMVILATPVLKIVDIARRISPYLAKGVIVTDAGSTKEEIVKTIESFLPGTVDFVGSHPLAGSERSGVRYANKDLFRGAYCILTKTRHTDLKALAKVRKFWKKLGMKVEVMTPERHDRVISRLSHLPHAVSVALVNACDKQNLRLLTGGFKDTTRIASSSPELWKDIFVTNRKNVAKDIKTFRKELSKIELVLKNSNSSGLLKLLKKAKDVRDFVR